MEEVLPASSPLVPSATVEGEIVPKRPETIDEVIAERREGFSRISRSTFDSATEVGRRNILAALSFNGSKGHKENEGWMGRPFDMIGITSKTVWSTKDGDGKPRPEGGVTLIYSVITAADGSMFSTSSDYVYESLAEIIQLVGPPSPERPIRVKLVKGGPCLKLVWAGESDPTPPAPAAQKPAPKK